MSEVSDHATLRNWEGASVVNYQSLSDLLYFPIWGLGWTRFIDNPSYGSRLANGLQGSIAEFIIQGASSFQLLCEKGLGYGVIVVTFNDIYFNSYDLNDAGGGTVLVDMSLPTTGLPQSIKVGNFGTNPDYTGLPLNWVSFLSVTHDGFLSDNLEANMASFLVSATIRGTQTSTSAKTRRSMSVAFRFALGALTLAQVIAKHDAVITALDGVTGGVIESTNVTIYPAAVAGIKTTVSEDERVQEGALLTFDLTGSTKVDSLFIPAIKNALVNLGDDSIDTEDALFLALLDELTVADGATTPAVNGFEFTYAALDSAAFSIRK